MHPSRQALLGGNTSNASNSSYDPPPHLRPQNNVFRQPSSGSGYGSFGTNRNGGDGTLGSSTNTIPLIGRGRWGQAKAANQNNVSFADQDERWGKNSEVKQSTVRQGWGERSAGAVGWGAGADMKARPSENDTSVGGDIWGTIPVEKEADSDMSWRKPIEQQSTWGAGKPVKTPMPPGGWGQTPAPAVAEQQQVSSGWDVPAPSPPGQPRSNTSSSRRASPKESRPSPQPSFQSQPQPRHQAPALRPPSQRQQQQPLHNHSHSETPYAGPIRSESSGWYDYATPAPQYSGLPLQNRAIPGVAAGWGSAATSVGSASGPAVRGNKAVEIKDPNRPTSAFAGWGSLAPAQSREQQQQQPQTGDQKQEGRSETAPSEWDTTETKIQRWTRSVDQASQAGGSEEADGMDISRSDAGWGPGEDEAEHEQMVDGDDGEKANEGWGASIEKKVEDDGWGSAGGVKEEADDGWGKPVTAKDTGGWGKPESNQENDGWGQPATMPQTTGWTSPTPANQRSAVDGWEAPSYPTRSPMKERQPLGPAAKGLIQRHLGGSGGTAGLVARPGVGGRKKPELPPPKSNPFDVAAGDIWSSLPAIDDDEVIRPPIDSGSESGSSSDVGSELESPTHKRPANMLGISRASLLPVVAHEDDVKSTVAEPTDTPGRMSMASTETHGSIEVHPGQGAGYQAERFIETPKKTAPQYQWSPAPADMLIDFDAPEESFSPPKQQPRALYENTSPGSMMTRSSTLIDMDDMLELKTPVTSPDRKWIGLDNPKDSEGFGHLAQGRSFQNAMDPGQLAMFEGAYSGRH